MRRHEIRDALSASACAAILLVSGCPDEEPSQMPPASGEQTAPEPEDPDAPSDGGAARSDPEAVRPKPPEPASAEGKPLDQMSKAELEAACFEGRQPACDRLGH